MVCAILINKVSVKCLPGLVHEVRHAVSVRLENIQVRHRSRSPPGSLSLTSQAFSGLHLVVVPRHCISKDREAPGLENTLVSVLANVLAFGIFKKVFHVYDIFFLVLSTNSNVVKVRKRQPRDHFPLQTSPSFSENKIHHL